MHAMRFLHTHLRKICPTVHATRLAVLLAAVETLTRQPRLTLTALGRALRSGPWPWIGLSLSRLGGA